jgi:hypothetical protein
MEIAEEDEGEVVWARGGGEAGERGGGEGGGVEEVAAGEEVGHGGRGARNDE